MTTREEGKGRVAGRERRRNPVALITGASSGIGYEMARLFAARRFDLVLVARTRKDLASVASELARAFGVRTVPVAMDLAIPTSPGRLHGLLARKGLTVDVLVNNAGVATYGEFARVDLKADHNLLMVNMVALTHLTKLFLRDMLRRNSGRIVNVASAAGFQPGPLRSTYFASKAYVLSLTEALAAELEGTGVRVSALCPGPTRTMLHHRAGMGGTRWAEGKKMDPRVVADAGFDGMMRGKVIIIPGIKHKLLAQAVRFVPRSLTRKVVKRMQQKRAG